MVDILDILRDFADFTDKIEHEMKCKTKAVNLPDEIDIYNFFEKWGGEAVCLLSGFTATMFGESRVLRRQTLNGYLAERNNCSQVKYHIGPNRYYALKFKNRGTFLVSEKRYNELKAKKEK